jgi:hypothetical protein
MSLERTHVAPSVASAIRTSSDLGGLDRDADVRKRSDIVG